MYSSIAANRTAIASPSSSADDASSPKRQRMNSRIMYIESKAGGLIGPARIGRVMFSRTRCTLYYGGQTFQSLKGGYKANYFEVSSGAEYWISGPKRDGSDRLYGERIAIEIDEDVRDEYWTTIRNLPQNRDRPTA